MPNAPACVPGMGSPSIENRDALARLAAQAEVGTFSTYDQHADVAFAGGVHGLAKQRRVLRVDAIEWRIREHDAADAFATFESNGAHGAVPLSSAWLARWRQPVRGIGLARE